MLISRFRSSALTLSVLVFAACASGPVIMPPEVFKVEMATATSSERPASQIASLTILLGQEGLSAEQRAEVLQARAEARIAAVWDKPAALQDLKAIPVAAIDEARAQQIEALEAEIAEHEANSNKLQSQDQWFADMAALGRLEAVALRYEVSELSPNAEQFYLLQAAGFVCGPDDRGSPIHKHGPQPGHLVGQYWCPVTPIS